MRTFAQILKFLKIPLLNDRLKKSLLTTGAGLMNQIVLVAIQLISVPLVLHYLGSEKFGFLSVITSFFFFWGSTDMGLSFGLQTVVPAYRQEPEKLQRAHATVFFAMLAIGFFLFLLVVSWLLVFAGITYIPFRGVVSDSDYTFSLLVLLFCFCFNMPLLAASNVLMGFQKGYVAKISSTLTYFLCVLCLFIGIQLKCSIVFIVAMGVFPGILSSVLNYIYFFRDPETKHLNISRHLFDRSELKKLLKIGLVFWILGLTSQLMFGWDNILVAKFLGLDITAKYSIMARIVRIFNLLTVLFFMPLLPAYNDAFYKNDRTWLRKTTLRNFGFVFIASIVVVPFIFLGVDTLVYYWLGFPNYFDSNWLMLICIQIIFLVLNAYLSYIMLTAPLIKKSLWIYPPAVLLSLVGKWYGVQYFGVNGLVIGSIVPYFLIYFVGSVFFIRREIFSDNEK